MSYPVGDVRTGRGRPAILLTEVAASISSDVSKSKLVFRMARVKDDFLGPGYPKT